jgi:hypothetical protein
MSWKPKDGEVVAAMAHPSDSLAHAGRVRMVPSMPGIYTLAPLCRTPELWRNLRVPFDPTAERHGAFETCARCAGIAVREGYVVVSRRGAT